MSIADERGGIVWSPAQQAPAETIGEEGGARFQIGNRQADVVDASREDIAVVGFIHGLKNQETRQTGKRENWRQP